MVGNGQLRLHLPSKSRKTLPSKQTYKIGEMFAGAGGMALGAHQAEKGGYGFEHAWVNDIDRDACDTFANYFNISRKSVFCRDAKNLEFDRLPKIDGFVFGFPCNDFSAVGDREGLTGKYGGLYKHGIRAIEAQKPLFFVAENVSGLASSGDAFDIILNDLKESGYTAFPQTYRFEEYGVPQRRHRIIVVGFRKDLGIDNFTHPKPTTKDNPMTSRQALADVESAVFNNELTKQSSIVIDRLKLINPGENVFTAALPRHLQLNMRSGATISQIYRRLKPDAPAYTVTGSGGGGTHIYHWDEPRALTNRERARLQTFPDDFEFLGGKESVRKQIGMAVPPKGAKTIFEAVLKTLIAYGVSSQC